MVVREKDPERKGSDGTQDDEYEYQYEYQVCLSILLYQYIGC